MSQNLPTRELFRDLFGSDEDDDIDLEQFRFRQLSSLHSALEVPNDYGQQQQRDLGVRRTPQTPKDVILYLLEQFITLGYFATTETNQMMHFGPLPNSLQWVAELYAQLASQWFDNTSSGEPHNTTNCWARQPLFDQLIGNMYLPGEGIRPHVDLARFEDGIGIVSLGSTCIMEFAHPDRKQNRTLWLEPGDVLAMSGEARYEWTHAIPAQKVDQVDGIMRLRSLRVSLTLRRVCPWTCVG
ncbi:hypothetical protein IWQ61_007012 [Dispira simplex]|nr:hypothetical protein IWQ61_007012 [Dispira simplex]